MNMRGKILSCVLILVVVCSFGGCANESKKSMKEQAWGEAIQYVDWYAEENDIVLTTDNYGEEKVIKNEGTNYTCNLKVKEDSGVRETWVVDVHKKNNGDWEVISVSYR